MKFVYLVMSGEGYGRVIGAFTNEIDATRQVNLNTQTVYGINPKTEPLDFDGTLTRYGWADKVWWQKQELYDSEPPHESKSTLHPLVKRLA